MAGLARSRWSAPRDLADAVAELAIRADLAVAERDGRLDEVEDELFRFGRVLDSNGDLALALGDTRAAPTSASRWSTACWTARWTRPRTAW